MLLKGVKTWVGHIFAAVKFYKEKYIKQNSFWSFWLIFQHYDIDVRWRFWVEAWRIQDTRTRMCIYILVGYVAVCARFESNFELIVERGSKRLKRDFTRL